MLRLVFPRLDVSVWAVTFKQEIKVWENFHTMKRRSLLAASAAVATLPFGARAQTPWPSQPIRMVVPYAAGGPTDVPARILTDSMSRNLPQRVVIENRTGAGVVIGTEVVASAPKDGNTLLYTTVSHSVVKALFPTAPFDPVTSFAPVALVGTIPMVLMVNKNLPVQNLQELIKLYRDNPGKYDYGSAGNGSALHLAAELFLDQAGELKVNHVPYRGSAAAMPDLLSGTLTMMTDVASNVIPFASRGEVRALAVAGNTRLPQLPDVPTFAEAGLPSYEAYTWHMVLAPVGTPEAAVNAANAAINAALKEDMVKTRLGELAVKVVPDSTPASTAAFLQAEVAKWVGIVQKAGIRVN